MEGLQHEKDEQQNCLQSIKEKHEAVESFSSDTADTARGGDINEKWGLATPGGPQKFR